MMEHIDIIPYFISETSIFYDFTSCLKYVNELGDK